MKKKLVSVLLAATMVVTTLAGCGNSKTTSGGDTTKETSADKSDDKGESKGEEGSSEEAVTATITVWSPQEDQTEESGKWLQTMCEQFSEEHPNWDLTFEFAVCPEGDAKTMVGQDPEAAADVYMFANDHIPELIAANGIAKLGGDTEEYVKTSNSAEIVDTVTVDGSIYGVPFTSNTWFMYYDKSVFTEDDIKSLDTMLEKGKVSFPVDNSWNLPAFFFANDATLFGTDGKDEEAGAELGGAAGLAATTYVLNMVQNSNFINDKDGSGLSGLHDGSVNAMFSGSWSFEAAKEALGDNMGIAQLPTITVDGQEKQLRSFAGSKAIGVNPNSKNMQVSVALAKYLGGEEAQKAHYETRSIIPSNVEVLKEEAIANDPLVKAQNDTINNTSVLQPFVSKMSNFWGPVENFGASILSGEVTLDNAEEMVEVLNTSINNPASEQ